MPSDRAFREVHKKLHLQKRQRSQLKADEQQNYVDVNRSIAVSFDSKELSRALKNFSKDAGFAENKGYVNSKMYEKQALHFIKTNKPDSAIKYLTLAHFLDPKDMRILSELARSFLTIGNCQEAIRCSDMVLKMTPTMEAIIVKAEALYNMCKFEHAFALFSKGLRMYPEAEEIKSGVLKCRKTITNKIGSKELFEFSGAKYFFDFLRRGGKNSVDNYLRIDQKSTWKKSIFLVNLESRRMIQENQALKMFGNKSLRKEVKVNQKRLKIMREDREYLRGLEKTLSSHQDLNHPNIQGTVKSANEYLQEREQFWLYFD